MPSLPPREPAPTHGDLGEIARVFLRLGLTAFGGPAAHIAMMEEEVVRRRAWLSHEAFLDLLGATNLIPGPNSTEMAIHLGRLRGGWRGLLLAGACFITPAAAMVLALAWGYSRVGHLPAVIGVLSGVKAVVLAVIAQALWNLGRTALKGRAHIVLALAVLVGYLAGVHELLLLLAGGVAMMLWRRVRPGVALGVALPWSVAPVVAQGLPLATAPTLARLFGVFVKIGGTLYGSGYVLLAFLRRDLVERGHWLTTPQLLDAVSVGQITPGPVFTTATFVGYLMSGVPGAVVATLGIFLPSFALVAMSGSLVPRLRASRWASVALDGVNVASLALMAGVTLELAGTTLVHAGRIDAVSVVLALGALVVLLRWRMNSTWLLAVGAIVGAVAWRVRG